MNISGHCSLRCPPCALFMSMTRLIIHRTTINDFLSICHVRCLLTNLYVLRSRLSGVPSVKRMTPSQCPTRVASALSCKTTTTRQPLLLLAYRSRVTGHNQAWPNPGALRRRNWPLGDHCRRRGVMGFASMLAYSLSRCSRWHIRYCQAAYALTFHIALSLVVFSASRVHPATPLVYRNICHIILLSAHLFRTVIVVSIPRLAVPGAYIP